ncbi:hypothetical protein KBY31_21730, partial [Ruegeria pomeroyi]|nr:hypothetical protein [Ruegeria pomeroyi]
RALAIAKRQLGDGVPATVIASLKDWHAARLEPVINAWAEHHRRSAHDVCARAMLKATLGSTEDTALLHQLSADLKESSGHDRAATALRVLAGPVWTPLANRLAKGPSLEEYGAIAHGMITFGESPPSS